MTSFSAFQFQSPLDTRLPPVPPINKMGLQQLSRFAKLTIVHIMQVRHLGVTKCLHIIMSDTRSLPYPVCNQYTTTTSTHQPCQQQIMHVTDNRLSYLFSNSSVNLAILITNYSSLSHRMSCEI